MKLGQTPMAILKRGVEILMWEHPYTVYVYPVALVESRIWHKHKSHLPSGCAEIDILVGVEAEDGEAWAGAKCETGIPYAQLSGKNASSQEARV